MHECINIELKIGDKLCYIIALDRSLSQSIYLKTLDSLVQNSPFLVVFTDDFNAKPKNSYKNDKCSFEGNTIENVTSQFSLKQVIKESTHILDNSSSCIDLIFVSRANLLIESGGHRSLHSNCHHQTVYSKFDYFILLLIYVKYGIINMRKRILSNVLLQCLTGKKLFQTLLLMKMQQFSTELF